MKLEKLTPEQEALLPQIRDEWLAHGLSTQAADRPEAEAGIREAYAAADLEPPKWIIWLDSPWAGALGQAVAPEVIEKCVEEGREDLISERVRERIYQKDDLSPQIRERIRNWWQARMAGAHWAGFYAFYDAMRRLGVEGMEPLNGQMRIAKSAGWWWAYRHFVIITERPRELHRDPQGRLHCETGPAISYPDGWEIWAWHGTTVEPWVIEGTASIEKIMREPNTEVRRCAIEARAAKGGWHGLVREAGWQQVGETVPDPGNPGQTLSLYAVPDVFEEPVNLLLMVNGTTERDGTRRHFGETVPADITDPIAAAAWQIGLDAADYAQTQRRT